MTEHPLKSLIASHLLGGDTGINLKPDMTNQDLETMVHVAMRIATEIEKQVAETVAESECLVVAHLLGGAKGLDLSPSLTDEEIERTVGLAVRVLNELDKQAV